MSRDLPAQGDETPSEGCPSRDTFQCNHCPMRQVLRREGRSDEVGIKTIGHWYCAAPACAQTGAAVFGEPIEATLARYAGRPHPGMRVTKTHLDQLILLGPTEEMREEARIARDPSASRWRALEARDRCAQFLELGDEAPHG